MKSRSSDPDEVFGVHRRAATAVAVGSTFMAVVFAVALAVVVVSKQAPWAPLGPYPVQKVTGTTTFEAKGHTYPAVRVTDDAVTVTGKKCTSEDVTVAGATSWFSVHPSGLTLQVGNGVRDRKKGCVTTVYVNQMPAEVKVWANVLFELGRTYVVMSIVGREQAQNESGSSEPGNWRTESFVILPPEPT